MVKLYLVRHGETVDNANKIMQGQTPGRLNANGVRQAREVMLRMKDVPVDVFVSSDLQRSIDTCRIIARPHGKDVVTTPLLRERDWGDFTGRYIPDLKDAPWPGNVEGMEAMNKRCAGFLAWLREHYDGLTVLAVGHGIINKALQAVLYHKDIKQIERMENAEVRVLEV